MLKSSNNMADSLAIWAFGSISEYQKYATEMIKGFGLTKTTIGAKDASGYNESTTSTAKELAEIGYRVMTHPVLSEIVALKTANVPVAGEISNTNLLLGKAGISGVKTGHIGEPSGYCIVSGYEKDGHVVTVTLLDADTRDASFSGNLAIVEDLQKKLVMQEILKKGDEVGYYDSWWAGKVPVLAAEDFSEVNYMGAEVKTEMYDGVMKIRIGEKEYSLSTETPDFSREPSLFERFLHVFGWKK
jgi:D-alanyl-D-alanine carboxypeptidase